MSDEKDDVRSDDAEPEPDPAPVMIADQDETRAEAAADEAPATTGFRMRRAPRYRSFGLTGAALGVAAGVVLALSFKATSDYSIQTITGYFAAMLALFGGLIGLGLAVLIERRHQ